MSAPVGGYETIQSSQGYFSPGMKPAPVHSSNPTTPYNQPMHLAVAARAGAVRDAMTTLVDAPMPEVNVYTEPLNPGAQLTLNDRVQLVLESCRPWYEFADMKGLNLPSASEAKLRVGHNIEVFFYNYLVIGFGLLTLTAFIHPLRAIVVGLAVVAAVLMYVIFPEDYVLSENVVITTPMKHVVVFAIAIVTLLFGGVLSLLFFFATIFTPIVLLHSLLREHSPVVITTI